MANRLGQTIFDYYERLLELDGVAVIFQGDDFGFNTQLLLPPDAIREYFLPWHKRCAELIHEKGRPYYLHSCGKIDALMDELIRDVRIDARHSFQDCVQPIAEAQRLYGDRIGVLGGIDVHRLAASPPDQLRLYVRDIIDKCTPGGRFAIGSGNSIPSYIPVENYLTLLDEALQ